jgi:hypothetical protein
MEGLGSLEALCKEENKRSSKYQNQKAIIQIKHHIP